MSLGEGLKRFFFVLATFFLLHLLFFIFFLFHKMKARDLGEL